MAFALAGALSCAVPSQADVVFVQQNHAVPQKPRMSVAVPFHAPQTAGNVNVIVVGWNDSTARVASVTDSQGNTYRRAVGPTVVAGKISQSIYYASNITSAPHGNTVTVRFNLTAWLVDIRVLEYRGIDRIRPVDVTAAAKGNGWTSRSGMATTTTANTLIFGANTVETFTSGAGPGFVSRVITPYGDIAEDRVVTSVGGYAAVAPLNKPGAWVMQMVAFRAASGGADVTPPTAPGNLTATAVTATSVALSWDASTDDVGVQHYTVFRDGAEIASVTGPQYSDTVSPSTTYSYTVKAVDAAGNASAPSGARTVTTPSQGGDTASSISQDGITFTFDSEKTVGQFANGDYWVLGPVTITRITPDFDLATGSHGFQVNPGPELSQSFDGDGAYYNASLRPALPYAAPPGASILKVISLPKPNPECDTDSTRQCLSTAAVLTVLGSVPPNNGATVFRPPYFGINKPLFSTDDMDGNLDILPRLPSAPAFEGDLPTLETALDNVRRVNVVHISEVSEFYPLINANAGRENPYAPGVSNIINESILRALVVRPDEPADADALRRQIVISVIQRGIDIHAARAGGVRWYSAGGTNMGMRPPLTFAALLLNNQAMKNTLWSSGRNDFSETGSVWLPVRAGVPPLWGQDRGGEADYWAAVRAGETTSTGRDPYGWIDGGGVPNLSYQICCQNSALKADSLVVHLIPGMQAVWNDEATLDYVERIVTFGVWTQPDPCAPVDQGGGPNPARPGECVLDPDLTPGSTFTSFSCQPGRSCGRFPAQHGTQRDYHLWQSFLAERMWPVFRPRW